MPNKCWTNGKQESVAIKLKLFLHCFTMRYKEKDLFDTGKI